MVPAGTGQCCKAKLEGPGCKEEREESESYESEERQSYESEERQSYESEERQSYESEEQELKIGKL